MKHLSLTLIACFIFLSTHAQTVMTLKQAKSLRSVSFIEPPSQNREPLEPTSPLGTHSTASMPDGYVSNSSVTAVKVGSTGSYYSFMWYHNSCLTSYPSVGSNGGSLALIYNPNRFCGTFPPPRTSMRYSLSTDGGQSWDIGAGNGNPAPGGCFGKGPLNTKLLGTYEAPNATLFSLDPNGEADSLALAYVTQVDYQAAETYGMFHGLAKHVVDSFQITQAAYPVRCCSKGYPVISMTHQYNPQCAIDRFWFLAKEYVNFTDYHILRYSGSYDHQTQQINWFAPDTVDLPFFTQNIEGEKVEKDIQIAFSPDGMTGWMAFLGDIKGGQDSTYNPVFVKSTDAGRTWEAPQEVDFRKFPALRDSLLKAVMVQDPSGTLHPLATGKATTAFQSDMVVDFLGNPHMLVAISAASTIYQPLANYAIYPDVFLKLYDITLDPYGDWNLIPITDLQSIRGVFGQDQSQIWYDHTPTVSRTPEGGKVFFSWVDTDSTQTGNHRHEAPNLYGCAYDVHLDRMTPVINWTDGDATFGDKVYLYQTAEIIQENGNQFSVPTVIPTYDSIIWQTPVDLWYIQDITYDQADFVAPISFVNNCKVNPQAHSLQLIQPSCGGGTNGQAIIHLTGGSPPYLIQWDAAAGHATADTVSQLARGTYGVNITDMHGCQMELTAILQEQGSPQLSINPLTKSDVSCHGLSDGAATVTIIGGLAPYTISWDNGETNASATALDSGLHRVWVADQNGCEATISTYISQPAPLTFAIKRSHPRCQSDSNGYATLYVSGGTSPYQYQWSNGSTLHFALGLASGSHSCQIIDANGCGIMSQVTLVDPAPLSLTLTGTPPANDCASTQGTLTASASGGTSPYYYVWPGAGSGSFVFGLSGGVYGIRVIDDQGCVIRDTISMLKPDHSVHGYISVFPETNCLNSGTFQAEVNIISGKGPFTYSWHNGASTRKITGTGQKDLVCTVTNADGCISTITYASPISQDVLRLASETFAQPNTATQFPYNGKGSITYRNLLEPVTISWDDGGSGAHRTDLAPGQYRITLTDACQQVIKDSLVIKDASGSICNNLLTLFRKNACHNTNNGRLTVKFLTGSGQYSYLWNTGDTTATISSLSGGNYSCIVTDLVSGWQDTITGSVAVSTTMIAQTSTTPDNGTFNGTASVMPSGGTAPYTILWNSTPYQNGPNATGLPAGTYSALITDSLGCELVKVVVVDQVLSNDAIYSPAIHLTISPNPAKDQVVLQLKIPFSDRPSWSLWNVQGQILLQGQLALGNKWKKTLQLGELPEGLYLLQIKTAKGMAVKKVEIVR